MSGCRPRTYRAITPEMAGETSGRKGTEMGGTSRKIRIAVGAIALVLALLAGTGGHLGIRGASALAISTGSGGWTPANFASSCKAAGGRVIEIDEGDIKYSK